MQRRCYTAAAFELLHLHRKVCQNKQLITVDKHKDKQQICTSLAVLKMHDHMSVIFAKTICACILPSSVRAYKLFSIVYFTNPQLVKYSTFFQFQTLIIIANVLIFTGFGPPPINSVGRNLPNTRTVIENIQIPRKLTVVLKNWGYRQNPLIGTPKRREYLKVKKMLNT